MRPPSQLYTEEAEKASKDGLERLTTISSLTEMAEMQVRERANVFGKVAALQYAAEMIAGQVAEMLKEVG